MGIFDRKLKYFILLAFTEKVWKSILIRKKTNNDKAK
jgi:hypothetical protein